VVETLGQVLRAALDRPVKISALNVKLAARDILKTPISHHNACVSS
jgi:hypothetical protein